MHGEFINAFNMVVFGTPGRDVSGKDLIQNGVASSNFRPRYHPRKHAANDSAGDALFLLNCDGLPMVPEVGLEPGRLFDSA